METYGKYMLVIYKTNINKRLSFYFEHKQLKQNEVDIIWPMEAGDQRQGLYCNFIFLSILKFLIIMELFGA